MMNLHNLQLLLPFALFILRGLLDSTKLTIINCWEWFKREWDNLFFGYCFLGLIASLFFYTGYSSVGDRRLLNIALFLSVPFFILLAILILALLIGGVGTFVIHVCDFFKTKWNLFLESRNNDN